MGIIYSLLGWTSAPEEPDPVTGLTPHEVKLVQNSWAGSSKHRPEIGVNIMLSLFKAHPEYKKLFPFADVPDDQLQQNTKFKLHCTIVLSNLGILVDHANNADFIIASLDKLASNHIKHGIPSDGFMNILPIIEDCLRPVTTDEEFAAWSKLLTVAMTYTTKKMAEGKSTE